MKEKAFSYKNRQQREIDAAAQYTVEGKVAEKCRDHSFHSLGSSNDSYVEKSTGLAPTLRCVSLHSEICSKSKIHLLESPNAKCFH